MNNERSPLKKYLLNGTDKDVSSKTAVNLRMLLNECCCDYEETDEKGKLEILKDILLLLMNLVFGNDNVKIVMGQEYKSE